MDGPQSERFLNRAKPATHPPLRLNLHPRAPHIAHVSIPSEIAADRPVLVVPDVHQDLGFLQRAVALAEREGAALAFLGDHVDPIDPRWRDLAALRAVSRALPELALSHPGGCLFIAGNHDVQALQAGRHRAALLIAGDEAQVEKLDQAMPAAPGYAELLGAWSRDFLLSWHLAAVVHGVLLSHAGVARRYWPWGASPESSRQAQVFLSDAQLAWEKWLLRNEEGPLFEVGPGRGGRNSPVGGPLWLDWDAEFVDDLPLPQVVGHTRGRDPRRKDRSWCIDAAQTCVGLLDPDLGLRVLRV
jgi:hypothetical protein